MMRRRTRRVLLGGLLVLVVFGPGGYHFLRLSLMQRALDRQLVRLQAEHKRLDELRERLKTDPTYIEGLIRSTFHHARPDEYVIPRGSNARTLPGPQPLSELVSR